MSSHPSDSPSDGEDEIHGERAEPARDTHSPPDPVKSELVTPTGAEGSGPPSSVPATSGLSEVEVGTEVEEEPITAKLADTIDESPVRVGSPFATDPFETHATPIEQIYDVGPLRYTAMGAVAAAAVVLFFALVGFWWFPAGGAMIAALGCMLSIFGLYSTFRYTSAGLLTVHLALFVMSYGRSLG